MTPWRRQRDGSLLPQSGWQPTIAHLRASATGVILAIAAVLVRRPDLLVIATPLLVIAVWSNWLRPVRDPSAADHLAHHTVREGEATTWRVTVSDVRKDIPPDGGTIAGTIGGRIAGRIAGTSLRASGAAEVVTAILAAPPFSTLEPASGVVSSVVDNGDVQLTISVRSTRWGRRLIGPARVVATSAWAAFRWTAGSEPPRTVTTLPLPSVFDSSSPAVHPVGLVGLSRSARPGDGSEFASVRPFQSGDRLRRIHWPRSMRTGTLHVTSTWSDQDSHVVIVVDASSWSPWLLLLVLVGAVDCATQIESNLGLLMILLLAWHWGVTVDDLRTPWTLVEALALALFHTAMAAAASVPSAGQWSAAMRIRWLRRFGVVATLTLASWLAQVALTGSRLTGSGLLLFVALVAMTASALLLRAGALSRH